MKTVAEHMIDVLQEQKRSSVRFGDRSQLDECARRSTHTKLMDFPPKKRDSKILTALEDSGKFKKTYDLLRCSTALTKYALIRVRVMTLKEEIGQ